MASVKKLKAADILMIKARLKRGDHQHDIAADYGLNQGRISEINTGKRFSNMKPDAPEEPTLF